jgi:hypothetical protein
LRHMQNKLLRPHLTFARSIDSVSWQRFSVLFGK